MSWRPIQRNWCNYIRARVIGRKWRISVQEKHKWHKTCETIYFGYCLPDIRWCAISFVHDYDNTNHQEAWKKVAAAAVQCSLKFITVAKICSPFWYWLKCQQRAKNTANIHRQCSAYTGMRPSYRQMTIEIIYTRSASGLVWCVRERKSLSFYCDVVSHERTNLL